MAHFDFLVLDEEWMPLFAVEFDGPTHQDPEQIERDRKKDRICKHFDLSLLRIDSQFTRTEVRQMSLLAWLCRIWLFERDFNKAQEEGTIPPDEPFLWFSVATEKLGDPFTFPYDLSLPSRLYLQKLHRLGRSRSSFATTAIYKRNGRIYCEAFFKLTDDWVAIGKSSIKEFEFRGIAPSEVAEELAIVELTENVKGIFSSKQRAVSIAIAADRLKKLSEESNGVYRIQGETWI